MAARRRIRARLVHVGCSGWVYDAWRGRLYRQGLPQRRWLERYAERYGTVEVNSTFYRLTTDSAVRGWVEATPDDFVFAVKASRYLTHIKRLTDIGRGIERFYAPLAPMIDAGKLGPVLWQLPENFRRDDARLAGALAALPEGRHCFEFRHESWFAPEVMGLLREHDAALVIGDHPERPFQSRERTTDWTFIRFHYGSRGRNGHYSDAEVDLWARRIAQWRRETEVFAYFNNDWRGYALDNADRLKRRLRV
jgi:uncharacterized protein YecE (DUF72 family)